MGTPLPGIALCTGPPETEAMFALAGTVVREIQARLPAEAIVQELMANRNRTGHPCVAVMACDER